MSVKPSSLSLCELNSAPIFQLEPDLIVETSGQRFVLDTKWKRANESKEGGFGVSQSDMYQLFAYGHRYLGGVGEVFLIYPRSSEFGAAVGPFEFSTGMRCWAIPFDLEADKLLLPAATRLNAALQRRLELADLQMA